MLVQQVYKTTFLGEIDAMMITLDFFLCLSQLFTVFFPSSRILLLLFLFVPKASDVSLYNDIIILLYYNYPLKFTMYVFSKWLKLLDYSISIKFYVLDPEQRDNTLKESTGKDSNIPDIKSTVIENFVLLCLSHSGAGGRIWLLYLFMMQLFFCSQILSY